MSGISLANGGISSAALPSSTETSNSNNNSNNTNNSNSGGAVEFSDGGGIGRALKLQTDSPHLVSMGGDRLSTSVTLHPIPQGRVTLGSGPGVDIPVQGTGVMPLHCHVENCDGVVTIYPLSNNLSIDGVKLTGPTRLTQGVMLTIGRSNYMRFNHPAEAKRMKSVLPNPRISMAPISFEPDLTYQAKFNKKPPTVPRKSPRDSLSDSGGDDPPPSSIMTKVSKFEYLAAQNLKSISPKVFSANLVTVNTPAKDVLGKAPPDLKNFSKNLPQSALNYSEFNHNDKQQSMKPDRPIFGRKSPQYVNVTLSETKAINNRVIIYENGVAKNQIVNIDHNELNNKSGNKNVNVNRVMAPSPSFNRSMYRSVTPSPVSNIKYEHRRSGSLGELTENNGPDEFDLVQRKNEAEIRRNQAQQDRIKEQEIEKAEQARLEEILNMCAEYEKQAQCEKNKPTPNRIKTNGSLPRDKRGQYGPPSPSYSSTPPQSPLDILHNELLKQNNHTYENVHLNYNSRDVNYENVDFKQRPTTNVSDLRTERSSPYENVVLQQQQQQQQQTTSGPYPPSPRTRIKTFVTSNKDNLATAEIIENKFAILEAEQNLLLMESEKIIKQNLNNQTIKGNGSVESVDLARKPTPTKFILPLDEENGHLSASPEDNKAQIVNYQVKMNKNGNEEEIQRVEQLRKEKREIQAVISKIKRQMAEIETQEEELQREIDLERALIIGEHKSKQLELDKLENRKEKLLKRAQKIEDSVQACQLKQDQDQKECKRRLQEAQEEMAKVEADLSAADKGTAKHEQVFELYLVAQDKLDNERKAFEDLEFHHLEEEADILASREEVQREISLIGQKIEEIKSHLLDLDEQKLNTSKANTSEYKGIEKQKMECLMRLEEIRNRLKTIDNELMNFCSQESEEGEAEISSDTESNKSTNISNGAKIHDLSCSIIVSNSKSGSEHVSNMSQSFNEKLLHEKSILEDGLAKKYPSQDDIDRISKVTTEAPINISEDQGSLGRKTIESLKEIERNRQLHLHQQAPQVIEQERQRVLALKQRVQQEVKTKWAQRQQDCISAASSGSEDVIRNSLSNEEETTNQSNEKNESVSHPQQSPISISDQPSTPRLDLVNNSSPRPLSETSEMSLDVGGGTLNKKRVKTVDKQRPLTRYLPIRGSDLNLRQHIESAGHQVVLCPHVIIDSSTCKGFLHKKGSKLNGWSRRWFVFDRTKHTFTYYSDKSEKKARGGAYFQAIEEVYLDHSNNVKSPNPQLTFIVKTHERFYYLMAPSPEAMRIWMDVIFTGAEGYREFVQES